MAFDSVRDRAVLFGGTNPAETWEWDGEFWHTRGIDGPVRYGHALAFDALRGTCVMFGGIGVGNETWTWDGLTWRLAATTGPVSRYDSAMAYDSKRGVVVLFGGRTQSGFNNQLQDTWEWDGTLWTQRKINGPPPRDSHAMVYDDVRGVVVLFGGHFGNSPSYDYGDTWEYDGNNWVQKSSTGPSARIEHAMVFDGSNTLLFGGGSAFGGNPFFNNETWKWNGRTWTQLFPSQPPSPRRCQQAAFDTVRNQFVLFGGRVGDSLTAGDTWLFSSDQWTLAQATTISPPSFWGGSMAFDSQRNVAVLATGTETLQYQFTNWWPTTWELSGDQWVLRATSGFPVRTDSALAFDQSRGVTVMFGGKFVTFNGSAYLTSYFNDVREWNGTSWTLRKPAGNVPSARAGMGFAYDSSRQVLVMFGGYSSVNNQTISFGDTWEWDGAALPNGAWTLRSTVGPPPRGLCRLAYDSARDVTVLFGGYSNSAATFLGDTWEWSGARGQWTLRSNSGPSPRARFIMAYDSNRGFTTLHGGSPPENSETWDWNGVVWTQRLIPSSAGRAYHCGAYDSVSHRLLTYGESGSTADTVWQLIQRRGDTNCDGIVNIIDLLAVIDAWGPCTVPCPPSSNCPADIAPFPGCDCMVNVTDLLEVINTWGL